MPVLYAMIGVGLTLVVVAWSLNCVLDWSLETK